MCNINGNTRDYIFGLCGVFSMEVEELKVIAEGVGYEASITNKSMGGDNMWVNIKEHPLASATNIYNPLTNNDQMVEIMERLKVAVQWSRTDSCWISEILFLPENSDAIIYDSEGKTINEAVCNAAYEYFKGLK